MELKHGLSFLLWSTCILLIVPYGIETGQLTLYDFEYQTLLIVPYGIETYQPVAANPDCFSLLIVPYGIETTSSYCTTGFPGSF